MQPLESRLLIPPLVKHSTDFFASCPAILVVELKALSILGKHGETPTDRYPLCFSNKCKVWLGAPSWEKPSFKSIW